MSLHFCLMLITNVDKSKAQIENALIKMLRLQEIAHRSLKLSRRLTDNR